MKKISLLLFCTLALFTVQAQTQNPVKWMASYKAINATEGEIVINAMIDKNWHTYSQKPSDAGPIPTSFTFPASKQYQLIGKTTESDAHEEFVKAFDAKITVFTDKAEFRQKIKLIAKPGFIIPFKVEFMSCNDMMCLPPKTIDLNVTTNKYHEKADPAECSDVCFGLEPGCTGCRKMVGQLQDCELKGRPYRCDSAY